MSTATAAPTLENVLYEKKGPVAYVTINRPKVLNALNKATIAELNEVFKDARDDAAVRGVIQGYGGTQRLPRLVGKGRALQLILSADMIDAQEAFRIGLVNEIVARDNLIPRAEAILNKINANAPTAVKLAIEAANRGLDVSLAEGLNLEASLFAQCFATEDRKEGVAAFREKRKPNFKGQ